MKRNLIILLAISLLLTVFIGCNNNEQEEKKPDPNKLEQIGESNVFNDDGTKNLNSYDRRYQDMDNYLFTLAGDKWVSVPNKDAINDERLAIYSEVEKKLNCKITINGSPSMEQILTGGLSGDLIGDFIGIDRKSVV